MVDHQHSALSAPWRTKQPANQEQERVLDDHESTKDDALVFIEQHRTDESASVNIQRCKRKVDLIVMPFLVALYALNFLDKVLLGYSAVMGLDTALELKGNDFSNASAAFWIADLVAVLPNIFLLNKLPSSKWLAFCLLCWGITTACHAAVGTYHGLFAVRILSGAAESAVLPTLMLLSSQYFTRQEQALRFAYWFCGFGLGQILGALISFGFQWVTHAQLESWRIMFLVLGLVTIVVAVAIAILVPDSPMQAKFLTVSERIAILHHTERNQTGIVNKKLHLRQLVEALSDIQSWTFFTALVLQSSAAGVITVYSPTLLKSLGYNSKQSALLNMPSGAFSILFVAAPSYWVRIGGQRWVAATCASLIGVAGACLLAFGHPKAVGANLTGIWLINAIPGGTLVIYHWFTSNTAGHTKRAFATALMNAAFAIGNIIGPEIFQAKYAPAYHPAKLALVCMLSVSIGFIWITAGYYKMLNVRRTKDAQPDAGDDMTVRGFAGLTDKENEKFSYEL